MTLETTNNSFEVLLQENAHMLFCWLNQYENFFARYRGKNSSNYNWYYNHAKNKYVEKKHFILFKVKHVIKKSLVSRKI